MVKSVGSSGASADATSPGMARRSESFSATAVMMAVLMTARACSGLTSRAVYREAASKNLYGFSSSSADVSRMLDSTSPAMAIMLVFRVYQSVEQMDNSGPRGSAHRHWVTREISLRDRRECSILLITNLNKLDCAISAQCVHHGVQSVSDDSITALDSSLRQHLPQYVCNFFST